MTNVIDFELPGEARPLDLVADLQRFDAFLINSSKRRTPPRHSGDRWCYKHKVAAAATLCVKEQQLGAA